MVQAHDRHVICHGEFYLTNTTRNAPLLHCLIPKFTTVHPVTRPVECVHRRRVDCPEPTSTHMPSLKWASAAAARYSTVSDDESVATSEPEKLALLIAARRPNIKLWIFTVVQTVFVVALAVSLHIVASRKPSDLLCAKQLSPYCK